MVNWLGAVGGEVGVDAVGGEIVDDLAQLGHRADAAEVVPVEGDRAGAGGAALLLDDEGPLDAALEAVDLVGGDAVVEPLQLGQHHVERFLGPLGGGAGVGEDRAAVAERVAHGIDRIDEAALLADLGEQPRAHAVAEHADRAADLKIVGMRVGHGVEGDADVRLARFGRRCADSAAAAAFRSTLAQRAGLPAAEEPLDVVLQPRPVDLAGDAEDRAARRIELLEMLPHVGDRQAADAWPRCLASCGPRARRSAAGGAAASSFEPGRPRWPCTSCRQPRRASSS